MSHPGRWLCTSYPIFTTTLQGKGYHLILKMEKAHLTEITVSGQELESYVCLIPHPEILPRTPFVNLLVLNFLT